MSEIKKLTIGQDELDLSKYTPNDGTLTIQHNGTTKGTFTANQSSASTINIETIYADDYIDTTPVSPFVTTSMIENNAVTAAKIDWSTFTYSTSEQRVGSWINGKPVYKKTVNTGTMPNNARKQVAHGISNLDFIISMSGAAYGSSTFVPIPYADTTASSNIGLFVGSGDIIIFTGANFSYLTTSYVTLYYTKTTD